MRGERGNGASLAGQNSQEGATSADVGVHQAAHALCVKPDGRQLRASLLTLGCAWAAKLNAPLLIDAGEAVDGTHVRYFDLSLFCGTDGNPIEICDTVERALKALKKAAFNLVNDTVCPSPTQRKLPEEVSVDSRSTTDYLQKNLEQLRRDSGPGAVDRLHDVAWSTYEYLGEASILQCAAGLSMTGRSDVKEQALAAAMLQVLSKHRKLLQMACRTSADTVDRIEQLRRLVPPMTLRYGRIRIERSGKPVGAISVLALSSSNTPEKRLLDTAATLARRHIAGVLKSIVDHSSAPQPPISPIPNLAGLYRVRLAAHIVQTIALSFGDGHGRHSRTHAWTLPISGPSVSLANFVDVVATEIDLLPSAHGTERVQLRGSKGNASKARLLLVQGVALASQLLAGKVRVLSAELAHGDSATFKTILFLLPAMKLNQSTRPFLPDGAFLRACAKQWIDEESSRGDSASWRSLVPAK